LLVGQPWGGSFFFILAGAGAGPGGGAREGAAALARGPEGGAAARWALDRWPRAGGTGGQKVSFQLSM
ncbi:hypothetical protein ACFXGY_29965, partial [Streptomyces sp. NPDC059346]|uniref:hypothetical protein n=1 Tax=Streptomyces sp. NPDC059346 TaxID=3346807 RepID=UPI0036AE96A0